MNYIDNIPRRCQLNHCTPAEISLYNTMGEIEMMGCDERLTKAITLLSEARTLVADVIDERLIQLNQGENPRGSVATEEDHGGAADPKIIDLQAEVERLTLESANYHNLYRTYRAVAERLSGESARWIPVSERPEDLPPECTVVLGYNQKWVDEDYNPEGIREAFIDGDDSWMSAYWNNTHDCWETDNDTAPTHWMQRPEPPKPPTP